MANNNKILPYIIFGVPILIGGFFLYKYIKKPKKGEDAPPNYDPNTQNANTESNNSGGVKPSVTKYFPLKKGSKGGKVKELQQALLGYDSKILPKFGADSDFGSETESAVQSVLGKKTIDSQEDINDIINKTANKKTDAESQKKKQEADMGRYNLGVKLVNQFRSSPSNFWAVHDTDVTISRKTSDGRLVNREKIVFKKGEMLPARSRSIVNNNKGYLEITDGDKFIQVSAYGVEVK